jgi:hypothetical protein
MSEYICYRNGDLYSIISPDSVLILNGSRDDALDAIIAADADPSILSAPVGAETFYPSLFQALERSTATLSAKVDTLTPSEVTDAIQSELGVIRKALDSLHSELQNVEVFVISEKVAADYAKRYRQLQQRLIDDGLYRGDGTDDAIIRAALDGRLTRE